jgi:lipoate-protein ligase A
MSSEVSRRSGINMSGPRSSQRFFDFARNDKGKKATRCLFTALTIYHDDARHSAAMNMAIDEALLDSAAVPSIRFYRWQSPALSFGYFGRFTDVADYASQRHLVRRWTGGGVVFHGDDLTYSIAIPPSAPIFSESSRSIYTAIHAALRNALVSNGEPAELAPAAGAVDAGAAIIDRRYNCFANPVPADVMLNGRKIAGAAQRRTRRGLLQQGSIQYVDLENGLSERFGRALSEACCEKSLDKSSIDRAEKIAEQKYGTDSWLRRR